jgi:hypothetical protein
MDDRLSEAEWLELEWRMELSVTEDDGQVRDLLVSFMNEHGRIPTPADDGCRDGSRGTCGRAMTNTWSRRDSRLRRRSGGGC